MYSCHFLWNQWLTWKTKLESALCRRIVSTVSSRRRIAGSTSSALCSKNAITVLSSVRKIATCSMLTAIPFLVRGEFLSMNKLRSILASLRYRCSVLYRMPGIRVAGSDDGIVSSGLRPLLCPFSTMGSADVAFLVGGLEPRNFWKILFFLMCSFAWSYWLSSGLRLTSFCNCSWPSVAVSNWIKVLWNHFSWWISGTPIATITDSSRAREFLKSGSKCSNLESPYQQNETTSTLEGFRGRQISFYQDTSPKSRAHMLINASMEHPNII